MSPMLTGKPVWNLFELDVRAVEIIHIVAGRHDYVTRTAQASSMVISDGNTADENIKRQTVFPSAVNVTSHSGMSENVFVSTVRSPPLRSVAATLPVIRRAICIAPTVNLIRGHISHKILTNLSLFIGLRFRDLLTWESPEISPRPTHQITQSSEPTWAAIFPGLQSVTELTGTRLLRCIPGLCHVAVPTPHAAATVVLLLLFHRSPVIQMRNFWSRATFPYAIEVTW